MKKRLLTVSALALAVLSGSAMAGPNSGEVNFLGVVTDTTCDIVADSNGSVTNLIQLGTVTTSTNANNGSDKGAVVDFALKPKAGNTCTFGAATNANISFKGNLGAAGVTNQNGTATDAMVKLTSVNANNAGDITSANNTAEVPVTNLADSTKAGATFQAQLIGGVTAGDFDSTVAYVVTYQ